MIELITNADKLDGRLVEVQGFLRITHEKAHVVRVWLYLHEEDSKNLLNNSVLIIPSAQMLKDEEKVDRQYVLLTGVFHVVRAADDEGYRNGGVLKDIRSCSLWSNPKHPIGDQDSTQNPSP